MLQHAARVPQGEGAVSPAEGGTAAQGGSAIVDVSLPGWPLALVSAAFAATTGALPVLAADDLQAASSWPPPACKVQLSRPRVACPAAADPINLAAQAFINSRFHAEAS